MSTASIDTKNMLWRDRFLLLMLTVGAGVLLAILALHMLKEKGDSNAYALIAESFLTQKPWASTCFGSDCALFEGKTYIVFPPFPALLAMPLVLWEGIHATGYVIISFALFVLSLLVWGRIFRFLGLAAMETNWLLCALGFASPLFYVTLRGDGVWFFAQATAFLMVSLALHEALHERLMTAGFALGAAFLSRQMSIFYAPLLLLLTMKDEKLFALTSKRFANALVLATPLVGALIAYFAYNQWRFDDPLNTGYNYINFAASSGMLEARVSDYGLWNKAYVLFNVFYMFIQGFHADFAGPKNVMLSGMDPAGTSILAASPWLLLMFFAPFNRKTFVVLTMMVGFTGRLLFYHSNGFSQYNTQRYTLDWLPAAMLVIAPLLTPERLPWVRLLILWGMVLNVATLAVLALSHSV